jgi:hypothetical protein
MRLSKYNQKYEIKVVIHQYETSQDSVLVQVLLKEKWQIMSCTSVKAKTIAGVGNCFGSGATLWKRRLAEGRTF